MDNKIKEQYLDKDNIFIKEEALEHTYIKTNKGIVSFKKYIGDIVRDTLQSESWDFTREARQRVLDICDDRYKKKRNWL